MLGRFDAIHRAERGLALVVVLAAALLAVALRPAPVQAGTTAALGWPESRQAIRDGSEVMLGEFLGGGPRKIPCEAYAPATVNFNGLSTDTVSAREPTAWYECGSLAVTDGFTSVALNEQEVRATAEPEITLDEPGGCVYGLAQVQGHEALEGRFVLYEVVGSATLKSGPSCAATLEVKGSLGVYGPQAGGFGVVPWVEISQQEREAFEKATHEPEERETAEKQRHEREERERREHAEREQHEREEKERLEKREILASLGKVFPTGKAATLAGLLKTGTWSVFFNAPTAGRLVVSWYEIPKGAHLSAKAEPVLVATGSDAFIGSGTKRVTIHLTRKGRQLLRHARRFKLTAKASFTPTGRAAVVSMRTFALTGRR